MKKHIDFYTKADQPLKERSRFWTWYMRGLHGDMDTRFEGEGVRAPRSVSSDRPYRPTVHVPEQSSLRGSDGLRFRPLASNTYGYRPKGGVYVPPSSSGPEPKSSGASAIPTERPWKDWSTPMKPLDDVMLLGPRRSGSVPRPGGLKRRGLVPSKLLRNIPLDPEMEELIKQGPWPCRRFANRLWRPSLFNDDHALSPAGSPVRYPWWWDFPQLQPLDLELPETRPTMRRSFLSPVKRSYLWGYHPLRRYGYYKY